MNMSATAPGAKNTASTDRREADSMLVAVNDRDQLHVRHFRDGTRNTSVVLLHDLFDDGSLFFRDSDALAPTLARAGFDVWVPDLRGKGRSFPALTPERAAEADYGFHAAVTEDLTTLFGLLREAAPDKPVYLIGHGVGGLLWLSFLARWPILREIVRGVVLLGTTTAVERTGLCAALRWRVRDGFCAQWLARRRGLVPGRALGLFAAAGAGNEAPRYYREVRAVLEQGWIDPVDGLDHAAQLRELPHWPPTLVLAAECDAPWSGAAGARLLQAQLPPHDGRLYVFPAICAVQLLGPRSALAGGAGAGEVQGLVLDWLTNFDG